jgi:hypothetical protein
MSLPVESVPKVLDGITRTATLSNTAINIAASLGQSFLVSPFGLSGFTCGMTIHLLHAVLGVLPPLPPTAKQHGGKRQCGSC